MSPEQIECVRQFEALALTCEQVPIETQHVLHGGVYTRTIKIPAGVLITGALIRVPTTLTISGDCVALIGMHEHRITGYAVLPASANRKQVFSALTETMLSMAFRTDAVTVEQAEEEFTEEAERLISRKNPESSVSIVTGE
jgi:hypothetical protein